MESFVFIPRLNVSVPSAVVRGAILGAFGQLEYKSPTGDQEEAILEFVKGHDVFVSLPTGAGKSLCYASLPYIFDSIRQHLQSNGGKEVSGESISIVVSPLRALMKDQVDNFQKRGLKCAFMGQDSFAKAAIVAGKYQLVFISPEYLLGDLAVRTMFRSDVYVDNLMALVVDEAHCIDTW